MQLPTRQDLVRLVAERKYGTSAEIGVRYGWFSKFILDNSNVSKHYAIDPWTANAELSADCFQCEVVYEHASVLLSPYGDRCEKVRGCSPAEANRFADKSLDFVYVDALHDYESVKADLDAWWPKVAEGGILAGHDFDAMAWPGVFRAVNEFAEKHQLTLNTTGVGDAYGESDGGRQSFWFENLPRN